MLPSNMGLCLCCWFSLKIFRWCNRRHHRHHHHHHHRSTSSTVTEREVMLQTAGRHVVEAVRLRAHHDLKTDDCKTVDVATLSASCWGKVLTQYLRRRPQLACNNDNTSDAVKRHDTRDTKTTVGV